MVGDPHRVERYGETWPQERIDAYLEVLVPLRKDIVLSGGMAWHFLSPQGHVEYKHAHDHKDLDLFVRPDARMDVVYRLLNTGFTKVPCRWTSSDFWRYEKHVDVGGKPVKLTIDFFLDHEGLPTQKVGEWTVVEPKRLLAMYGKKHTSQECWAVVAARRLIAQGINPVGHPDLVAVPEEGP